MSVLSDKDKAVLNSIFNPLLPLGENIYDADLTDPLKDNDECTQENKEAKELETLGVIAAEKGRLEEALIIFTNALIKSQTASGYNNRAQTYRLLNKDEEAMADLKKSLDLSKGQGRSGCNALCQKGLLHRKASQLESAKADFDRAAQLGSQFAKQQLVEMNPYSAMCNQMLSEMMIKLTRCEEIENGHGN